MRSSRHSTAKMIVPHQGSLYHTTVEDDRVEYVIEIVVDDHRTHELRYTREDLDFANRLFAIVDVESRSVIDRSSVEEFVTLRCPVFWRRDDDLKRLGISDSASPTFDEIWKSVVDCCRQQRRGEDEDGCLLLGPEGWMVFCRFVALAQYLEAKRRFSARHLQQTMRHRNAPRGSEMVVVDVPPPEPPAPLTAQQLANYETKSKSPLPVPELDLDHSLLAAHDTVRRRLASNSGFVKISLFGPPSFSSSLLHPASGTSSANLEFAVAFVRHVPGSQPEELVVRRSMADMRWLDDTFASHKVLGGTLCGRILPPFPGSPRGVSSHFPTEDSVLNSSLKTTSGAISAAAANGVGRIRDAAKTIFGNYLNTSGSSAPLTEDTLPSSSATTSLPSAPAPKKKSSAKATRMSRSLPESYYNPNSPTGRARHLERYLNYLLEHPALSTSFPLNTILKASQSGLEAAKESLRAIQRKNKEIKDQTPHLEDGKVSIPFWPSNSDSSASPNLAWVRTAAQAAMALKVHGMLETTGMNSASARLQHASLPAFGPSARSPSWDDHDNGASARAVTADANVNAEGNNFEEGVVSVQSELQSGELIVGDDGYDLLPLPVPAPERRILSVGSDASSQIVPRETRFHYGSMSMPSPFSVDEDDKAQSAYLGDISVDDNIDKLREVIGSVDNTLSRCLASIGGVGNAQKERQTLHLEIVKGLDSWGGMRGKFISQRSLLKGVSGIEQSKDLYEEGDLSLIDDISWQTSLAKSAVTAAEDVRSAVRVSRTAANAKAAASSAAFAAQNACDTGKFSSIDEARAAQTRASIAQSHAIHAAVVEHEAKTVKRHAALALANDVKCWNVHRKREMLHSCMAYARSQHEATRRAVDAWSSLRDGFIGSTMIPTTDRRPMAPLPVPEPQARPPPVTEANEVTATIYEDLAFGGSSEHAAIVAVDHHILSAPRDTASEDQTKTDAMIEDFQSDLILPFATAAPIPEEDEETTSNYKTEGSTLRESTMDRDTSASDERLSASMQSLVDGLMNWGGGFDAEEDHFALPMGMAASIALEESSVVGASSTRIA